MSQKNAPFEPDDYDNQDCDAHCDTHPDPSFFNLDLSPWKPRNTLVRVFKRHRCIDYIYGEDCTLILVRPERYTGTPGGASHLNSVTTARLHATPSTRHIKRMEMQRDRKGWGTLSCARASRSRFLARLCGGGRTTFKLFKISKTAECGVAEREEFLSSVINFIKKVGQDGGAAQFFSDAVSRRLQNAMRTARIR